MRGLRSYLVVLMVVVMAMAECSESVPFRKYHVHIVNNLEGNENLHLSCKSKDDNLGVHDLKVNEEFSFSFRENIWRTTLFWCNFEWREGNGEVHHGSYKIWWDAAYGGGDVLISKSGKNCLWSARKDGLYLRDAHQNQYGKVYVWES